MNDYEPSPSERVRDQVANYEATDGAEGGTLEGKPVVILTTTGARSGRTRKTPVMRIVKDGTYVAVASAGGAPHDPGWYHNLVAHPVAELQDGAEHRAVRAREIHGAEKDRWWVVAESFWPHFPAYRANAGREIPMFLLEPLESTSSRAEGALRMDLKGTRALITGATSGIGKAIATRLGADGADVLVHGRNADRGIAVVEAITLTGGQAQFVAADLTDPAGVRALVDQAGDIDVLVNNSGASWFGPTADLDVAGFDALVAGNVRAAYLLVAAFAPGMAARGHGSIVNISSMVGRVGLRGAAAYGGTKAMLESMTRHWAVEYGTAGVRVNTVAPGPVYTEGSSTELIDMLGATTPLNRGAQPDEIAEVVAFLASPAASYITGATVAADGGRTAV